MDPLTKSLLPLRYYPEKDDEDGDQDLVFYLEHPTVRQVLLLYGMLPMSEKEFYRARIRLVMEEWLAGSGLLEYLAENKISWNSQTILIVSILKSCQIDPDIEKEKSESLWGREFSMSQLLAEYRYWYRSDVMNEPWAFFWNQIWQLEKLKADVGLANLLWYGAGKSEKLSDELLKRAGYRKGFFMEDDLPNEDEQRRQMENARMIADMMVAQSGKV